MCEAEEAGYNAANDDYLAKKAAREAAQEKYDDNPTPVNLAALMAAMMLETAALAAKNAAFSVWQNCLMGSGGI